MCNQYIRFSVTMALLTCSLMVSGQIISPITQNTLTKVYYKDSLEGFAIGYSGTILKTTDGGNIWLNTNAGLKYRLFDIQFTSSGTGYIAASNGKIFKTINGGDSWIMQTISDIYFHLFSICFTSDAVGYVVGGGRFRNGYSR